MSVTVQITHADIQRGKKFSLDRCPWGLAVARVFPNNKIVVGYSYISVENAKDGYRLFSLKKDEAMMIEGFEKGEYISEHSFDMIEVPRK